MISAEAGFLGEEIRVVNVGLPSFGIPVEQRGAGVVQVEWQPPYGGDPAVARLVALLEDDIDGTIGGLVRQANAEAVGRILQAKPVLVGVRTAGELIGAERRMLLHAGPPVLWENMCGPMRGAVLGAILFERWATTLADGEALAESGAIQFAPCHHHGAVGPMAGVISPSMPVWVVRNETVGNVAFSTLNEGMGKVLRFGANGPDVIKRLRWMADVLGPTMRAAVERAGPIDLKAIIAQALQMGDEGHNRVVAATALFTRLLAPAIVRSVPSETAAEVFDFLQMNIQFFLNLSMASCKASLDAARGIRGSTVLTAMARNGVELGIQVSGTGNRWFTAPAAIVDAIYFPGYGPVDANRDIGDSAITETAGIGACAMAGAPAIVRTVGGTVADALRYTQEMATITLARNPDYAIPAIDFAGSPTGIDARKVAESRTAPVINTGVAHREPGIGQIGAGIVRAPMSCFVDALVAIGEDLGLS